MEPIENKLEVSLIPIEHQDLFDLFIDSSQCIYSIDADQLYLKLGNNLDESMDNLFIGRYTLEINL